MTNPVNFSQNEYDEKDLTISDFNHIRSTKKDFKKNEDKAFKRYQQLISKQRYKTIYN